MNKKSVRDIVHAVILDWSLNEVQVIIIEKKKDSKSLVSMMTTAVEKYIEDTAK